MNAHNFLQRYNSLYSESLNNGVRYLTRTKLLTTINFVNQMAIIAVVTDINKDHLGLKHLHLLWNSLKISMAN